uniref:Uncharacterized protein n=1 Tax=Lepeophtheirus salmonis TaxID=72036 RepID=A0A0K2U6T8_LEPSM
MLNVREVLDRH